MTEPYPGAPESRTIETASPDVIHGLQGERLAALVQRSWDHDSFGGNPDVEGRVSLPGVKRGHKPSPASTKNKDVQVKLVIHVNP